MCHLTGKARDERFARSTWNAWTEGSNVNLAYFEDVLKINDVFLPFNLSMYLLCSGWWGTNRATWTRWSRGECCIDEPVQLKIDLENRLRRFGSSSNATHNTDVSLPKLSCGWIISLLAHWSFYCFKAVLKDFPVDSVCTYYQIGQLIAIVFSTINSHKQKKHSILLNQNVQLLWLYVNVNLMIDWVSGECTGKGTFWSQIILQFVIVVAS